jgi:glycerophosphoryl diester phosphodiesterase
MAETRKDKPLWISHRGYQTAAAENTHEAFQAAVELGFTALETDLRMTKDRHIVLIHDPTLKRLAGDARPVCELSRSQLEKIRFKDGGRPLFFDEFMRDFAACMCALDIKAENGLHTIQALAEWWKRAGEDPSLLHHWKFLTWRESHEKQLRALLGEVRFYARELECWRAGLAVMAGVPVLGGIKPGRTYAIAPSVLGRNLFRKSMVRPFHERGARTIAYLPVTLLHTRAAVEAGFDEILTNGPLMGAGGD